MDISLRKSIRNGIITSSIVSFISLIGGIYNEFILEGLEVSFENIIFLFLGILLIGIGFFVPGFVVSLIYFYFKKKK